MIESKLDKIIELLAVSDLSSKDAQELCQYFINSLQNIATCRDYIAGNPLVKSDVSGKFKEELEIIISHNRKLQRKHRSDRKKKLPTIFRIIIAGLLITLGFAMIILPAPPYFEIYTIFYFNEQDGFTLMDLISLIIVFCGILMLIMAVQRDKMDNG